MSTVNQAGLPGQKSVCTGDVWCGCLCTDCTVTFDHCRPNQHPVESTYRPCCNVIGAQHAANCPAAVSGGDELDVALAFDRLANLIELARNDGNELLDKLPADAPLFGCADLATAICHLKRAGAAVERSADQIAEAVAK